MAKGNVSFLADWWKFFVFVATGLVMVLTSCAEDFEAAVLTIDNGNNDSFELLVNGESIGSVPGCSRGTELSTFADDPCAYVVAEDSGRMGLCAGDLELPAVRAAPGNRRPVSVVIGDGCFESERIISPAPGFDQVRAAD